MKRTIAILMALALAILCCTTALADEEVMIRFLDTTWGKDLETMCQVMKDAGWINDDGAAAFTDAEAVAEKARAGEIEVACVVPEFTETDGHYSFSIGEEIKNALPLALKKEMLKTDWESVPVESIEMIYALNGAEEKLLTVILELAENKEDLKPEFAKRFGEPADVSEDGTAYWIGVKNGEKKSILVYDGESVMFSLIQAKEKAEVAVPSK